MTSSFPFPKTAGFLLFVLLFGSLTANSQLLYPDPPDYDAEVITSKPFKSHDQDYFVTGPIGNSMYSFFTHKKDTYIERIDIESLEILSKKELKAKYEGYKGIPYTLLNFEKNLFWVCKFFLEKEDSILFLKQELDPISLEPMGDLTYLAGISHSGNHDDKDWGELIFPSSNDNSNLMVATRDGPKEGVPTTLRVYSYGPEMELNWERKVILPYPSTKTDLFSWYVQGHDTLIVSASVLTEKRKEDKTKGNPWDVHVLVITPSEESSSSYTIPAEGSFLRFMNSIVRNDTLYGMLRFGGPEFLSHNGFMAFKIDLKGRQMFELVSLPNLHLDIMKEIPKELMEYYKIRVQVTDDGMILGFEPLEIRFTPSGKEILLMVIPRTWMEKTIEYHSNSGVQKHKTLHYFFGDVHFIKLTKDWKYISTERIPLTLKNLDGRVPMNPGYDLDAQEYRLFYNNAKYYSNDMLEESKFKLPIEQAMMNSYPLAIVTWDGVNPPKRIVVDITDKKAFCVETRRIRNIDKNTYFMMTHSFGKSMYVKLSLEKKTAVE
ncbi:MAG: hypothetical protein LPK47_05070 [Bacteroidota bacterium]|nr:hypothetical protein [Bacteroidota bacterium]